MKPSGGALALLLLAGPVFSAQPVYRCGPDRSVYSQQPCADGAPVSVDDARSAAQRADALALRAKERRLAEDMARQREQAAKAARPAAAAAIAPAESASGRSSPARETHRTTRAGTAAKRVASAPENDRFSAIVPASAKPRPASAPAR